MSGEIERLAWLALECVSVRRTNDFYGDLIDLPSAGDSIPGPESVAAYRVGTGTLGFRMPDATPPGGRHTHFAVALAPDGYGPLRDRLSRRGAVTERTFGGNRSMYLRDPAGHVVEFGERPSVTEGFGSIFEVVLEVDDLGAAERRYRRIGFSPVDRGEDRPRVRLSGAFALELWEPHRGIADARGGEGVELGLATSDPAGALTALDVPTDEASPRGAGLEWVDPDGHRLVFVLDG